MIDPGRQQLAVKRPGQAVVLAGQLPDAVSCPEKAACRDERKAAASALVELIGITAAEAAQLFEVPMATMGRDLRLSQVWLASRL